MTDAQMKYSEKTMREMSAGRLALMARRAHDRADELNSEFRGKFKQQSPFNPKYIHTIAVRDHEDWTIEITAYDGIEVIFKEIEPLDTCPSDHLMTKLQMVFG